MLQLGLRDGAMLASNRPQARQAIDIFTFRISGEMTWWRHRVDAIAVTAGIGENQPPIRAMVCERLAWLGLEIDARANERNAERTSNGSSRIAVFVIATDEEQVIAGEALSVLKPKGVSRGGHR
jgi:acetate kinase